MRKKHAHVCVGGEEEGYPSVVGPVRSVSAFVCVERGCTYWGVCEVCGGYVCVVVVGGALGSVMCLCFHTWW